MSANQEERVLSVSCVTFKPDYDELVSVFEKFLESVERKIISRLDIYLVDNGPHKSSYSVLMALKERLVTGDENVHITIISGHGNIGYGAANNLAINEACSEFHLIINPDVFVEKSALSTGLNYLSDHQAVGMLCAQARDEKDNIQYIAKRFPSLYVLALRLFVPESVNKHIKAKLSKYEYRDLLPTEKPLDIDLASGCFMLCRTEALKKVGGFDPLFFMYFEDFDLSLRIGQHYRVVHHPGVNIVHLGGGAGRKGFKHVLYFVSSAFKFFNKHGWKFY